MYSKRSNRFVLLFIVLSMLLVLLVPAAGASPANTFTLRILHTNDTHAHLESFTPWGGVEQGGIARRYTLVKQIRAEGGNILLVDAGDVFQGTLYFIKYEGQADLWFMNRMGYEVMTVGNHEFDKGQQPLANFIDNANFPVLSANLDVSGTPVLNGKIKPYIIKEIGGQKVGIFGLTTPDVKVISNIGEGVVVKDPIETARQMVQELQSQGINKIIALTHLGYNEDKVLAAAVDGIDVIVGGHSHTLLGNMAGAKGPYPTVVDSPDGDPVLIVTAKCWGSYLGDLTVTFDENGKVTGYSGQPHFIDASIQEDPVFAAKLQEFAAPVEEMKSNIVGQAAVDLDGEREHVRTRETNLGDLVTDTILWKTASDGTQIAIQNGGGIRSTIPAGDVSLGKILEVLPFGNQIVDMDLTGQQVWDALENGVSQVEGVKGRFPQVSGLRFVWDPTQPPGSRIVDVQVGNKDTGYTPLDLNATYRVAVNDFMSHGGDGYDMLTQGTNVYRTGVLLSDTLMEYFQTSSPVSAETEGRIVEGSAPFPSEIPEGSTLLLVLTGFGSLGIYLRSKKVL